MTSTGLLSEIESDLAVLTSLPGEIGAKTKRGIAALTRVRDSIEALTRRAEGTLATLEALAAELPLGDAPATQPTAPETAPETASAPDAGATAPEAASAPGA